MEHVLAAFDALHQHVSTHLRVYYALVKKISRMNILPQQH